MNARGQGSGVRRPSSGVWRPACLASLIALTAAIALRAQPPAAQPPPPPPSEDRIDEGISVTNELVVKRCAACHKADEKKRLTRISYRRTTPEGWQETIRRMVALNGVTLDPAEARDIVAYLANNHGLAPEEAKPAAFEVERRRIDYKYEADKDTETTCIKCHSMGRVISQRRTKEEWELLLAMHRGFYPLIDFQAFRRGGPPQRDPGPDGRPPDNRHPMEKAVAHLERAFPLTTPEWTAWSATMRPPRLDGRWALAGYQAGKGPVFGEVTIAGAGAEVTTTIEYVYARGGATVNRSGRAIVYTGFQWRGRSEAAGTEAMREVMFVDRDWRTASGRWFTGAYDEIGIDITLRRIGRDPMLLGTSALLRSGAGGQEVRIYGVNLPPSAAASDFNFGPGVTVTRVGLTTPDVVTVTVDVAPGSTIGLRDVFLTGATGHATVALYDKIDGIKVTPQAGMARVGGANFPKQHEQFEAIAYSNGADGRANTKDDVSLGIVDATWSIEEYAATFDDDDKDFVGSIDPSTGLFTPNLDGPNPKRRNNTNNYGDVWVVATFTPKEKDAKPLRARAHLLVTVPLYIRWEAPETAGGGREIR